MNKLSDLTPEQRLDLGEKLREMPEQEKAEFIRGLTEDQRVEIAHDPIIHLRKKQFVPPDEDKNIAVLLAGRGE